MPQSEQPALPPTHLARQVLGLVGAGYWLLDREPLTLRVVSEHFSTLLGLPADTTAPDLAFWLERCHGKDRDNFLRYLRTTSTEDASRPIQIRLRNSFGIWIWLEVNQQGSGDSLLVSFKDITSFKELETAAHNSHLRYHSLYTTAPLGLILWNREGLITGWNHYAEKLFGWQEPEVIGKKIHELLFAVDQAPWFAEQIRNLLHNAGEGRFASNNLTRDGQSRRCEWSNVPLRNPRGQLLGVMSLVLDVSEQWAAETRLREAAQMYRALVETSPDAIVLTDTAGRVLMANQQCGHLFGQEHFEELIGQPFSDYVNPDHREQFRQQVLHGLSDFVGFVDRREILLDRRDGDSFNAELSYTAHASPQGEAMGLILIVRDITERIQRNQELLSHRLHLEQLVSSRTQELDDANRALAQIIEGSPVAIFVVAADGTITHWNSACAQLMRTPASEVLGTRRGWATAYPEERPILAELVMHRDPEQLQRWYGPECRPSAMISGAYEVEGHIPRLDRWLVFTAAPLYDKDGKVIGAIETLQDVSGHKQAEQALIEARQLAESAARMKAEFLANMSHELRTPMNAVIGLSHLLQKSELDNRQREYVNKIQDAGNLLLHVVNDVLDFSKIEAGHMQLEKTGFALERTLNSIAGIVQQPAQDKGLELHFVIEPEVPDMLIGDPLRLSQILTNLLSNAIKFTAQGFVAVFVRCLQRQGDSVTLEFAVQDTGIGMSEEQIKRLFQAFSQADTSITRQFGGTGLGLVISRRLIEIMGGQISVRSDAGIGSTFTFTACLNMQPPKAPVHRSTSLRALVVDDQAIARTVLVSMLNKQGLTVASAATSDEAMHIIQRDSAGFDWFFIDWKMPDTSGTDLAARIRNHYKARGKTVNIALVTAASPEQLDVALRSGLVDRVLVKPVFPAHLSQLLSPTETPTVVAPAEHPLIGLRVLVVEDIPTNQMIARDLLEELGATVAIAEHGKEAIDLLRSPQSVFDLVLMDIQMPVMDGLQATRIIRQQISQTLPIIAMTAHALHEGRNTCESAGMNDFLTKPIDPEKLETTLRKWMQNIRDQATPPVSQTPSTSSPVQANPALHWDLPGIDIDDGLRRMMNKTALYEKVLRDFYQRFHGEIERIETHLARQEQADAERRAHSLKGLAGSIGAIELFGTARLAEQAIRSGDNLAAALAELTAEHHKVMQGIARQFDLMPN